MTTSLSSVEVPNGGPISQLTWATTYVPLFFSVAVACSVTSISIIYLLNKPNKRIDNTNSNLSTKISYTDNSEITSEQNAESLATLSNVGVPHPFSSDPKFDGCIYLDYNATTPVFPEVYQAMIPFLTVCFGNPSSDYIFSQPCRQAIQLARSQVGQLINATDPEKEIFFTSCGTESDNGAIDIAIGYYFARMDKDTKSAKKPHIITSAIEHPAILNYLRRLLHQNRVDVTILPVNSEGFVSVHDISAALCDHTALVTVMHSNNEVGTIQPIREIGQCIKLYNQQHLGKSHVLFHSDAAQSLGKVLLDVQSLGVDMLTIVGHKYGAPKGVAALFIRSGMATRPNMKHTPKVPSDYHSLSPLLVGGGQERGLRAGTENVPLIVALGHASELALQEASSLLCHLLALKFSLIKTIRAELEQQMGKVMFNGPKRSNTLRDMESDLKIIKLMLKPSSSADAVVPFQTHTLRAPHSIIEQLPNTVNISLEGIVSHNLIKHLSSKVAFSAGSACHASTARSPNISTGNNVNSNADSSTISSVLTAIGVPTAFAVGTLRLSFGRHTTEKDVVQAANIITSAVKQSWEAQQKLTT